MGEKRLIAAWNFSTTTSHGTFQICGLDGMLLLATAWQGEALAERSSTVANGGQSSPTTTMTDAAGATVVPTVHRNE